MSAYLDKSQGITFVYSNIYDLYKKAKDSAPDAPFVAERKLSSNARVIKDTSTERVEEFKPQTLESTERSFPVPMGVREAEEKAMKMRSKPIADLRKNLNELNDAHENSGSFCRN